jgi:hypothetical protein
MGTSRGKSLGCAFRFLFRFFGDLNLEQDSGSGPDSGGIRLEHTLMFQLFKRLEPKFRTGTGTSSGLIGQESGLPTCVGAGCMK